MANSGKAWIPAERIEHVVTPEPALVILGLALIGWLVYKLFMRNVSRERHRYLRRDFESVFVHIIFTAVVFSIYWILGQTESQSELVDRVRPYLGLVSLVGGLISLVKTVRILAYEYLIFWHMREGVPVLILNLVSLILGVVLAVWTATSIFAVDLGPLLATSAFLSVVMGLALQDTLGNLFAGIAMQFDWKPYEIGDWVEVNMGGQAWLGQVNDVSWRATTLLGNLDEMITVPNKVMAQSFINNYSTKERPMIRTQTYRFRFEVPVERVKEVLVRAIDGIAGIRVEPKPFVIVRDTTESWVVYRLVYYIDDFGLQFLIGDSVHTAVLRVLRDEGLEFAVQRIAVEREAS